MIVTTASLALDTNEVLVLRFRNAAGDGPRSGVLRIRADGLYVLHLAHAPEVKARMLDGVLDGSIQCLLTSFLQRPDLATLKPRYDASVATVSGDCRLEFHAASGRQRVDLTLPFDNEIDLTPAENHLRELCRLLINLVPIRESSLPR